MKIANKVLVFLAGASAAIAQSTGTFTATGSMVTPRGAHTATLLNDGRVLLAGGFQNGQTLATAELYDPSSGTFSASGDMTVPRTGHQAILLPDGKVLIIGDRSAEVYDPSTATFSPTADTTTFYGCNTATLLANGKVLIVDDPFAWKRGSADGQIYDPVTDSSSPTGPYASAELVQLDRTNFPSAGGWDCPKTTLLPNGKVLMVSGVFAELYDPDTNTFSLTGTQVTLGNGFIKTLPSMWYDPSRATLLLDGTVLYDGGDGDLGPVFGAWLYRPSSGTFGATGTMATPRLYHTATLLPDGTILVAGSIRFGPLAALGDVELFDPAIGIFSAIEAMLAPRYLHTATLLKNGKLLIAGGITASYTHFAALSTAELYTPSLQVPSPVLRQGAILHATTHQVVSPENPALLGESLEIYCTGLLVGSAIPLQVVIGGRMAEVLFFGNAPGLSGVNQVNVRVPDGIASGTAVPVRLNYLSRPSNAITIAVAR